MTCWFILPMECLKTYERSTIQTNVFNSTIKLIYSKIHSQYIYSPIPTRITSFASYNWKTAGWQRGKESMKEMQLYKLKFRTINGNNSKHLLLTRLADIDGISFPNRWSKNTISPPPKASLGCVWHVIVLPQISRSISKFQLPTFVCLCNFLPRA